MGYEPNELPIALPRGRKEFQIYNDVLHKTSYFVSCDLLSSFCGVETMKIFHYASLLLLVLVSACTPPQSLSKNENTSSRHPARINPDAPVVVRMIRCYGGADERTPPILMLTTPSSGGNNPFSSSARMNTVNPFGNTPDAAGMTIEFDVSSSITPSVFVRFVHCTLDWQETRNTMVNDPAQMRTSLVQWEQLAVQSEYARYRGKVRLPNAQVQFRFAGNWKAHVFDLNQPDTPLAETRFFVVQPEATVTMTIQSDIYQPVGRVSPAALLIEGTVSSQALNRTDAQVQSMAVYRNQRWYEPFIATEQGTLAVHNRHDNYMTAPNVQTNVFGMLQTAKQFRFQQIPAQNEYRILPTENTTIFPPGSAPSRFLRADLRRNGNYVFRADDGTLITTGISSTTDDYVHVEFVFDPEGFPTRYDMYVLGSFNQWRPRADWKMQYDETQRLYTLRQWMRRGRHNYLYATGYVESPPSRIDALNTEEYEGNVVSAGHTFIGFVYAREIQFGGYDAIIGTAKASTLGR